MTDAEGRVEVLAPPSEPLDLVVLTAGGRARAFTVRPEERRDRVAVLAMRRAEPLAGTVVDAGNSSPLPGAWVWSNLRWRDRGPAGISDAMLGDLAHLVRTDPGGRFNLEIAARTQVRAAASGYVANDVLPRDYGPAGPAVAPIPRERITVRLKTSRWLAGTVVDVGGQPIAGALVIPFRGPAQAYNTQRSTTDGQGRFRIGVGSPSSKIVALARGYSPVVEAVDLGDAPSRNDLRIVLRRGRLVHGRVVDLEERPVANARVRLAETPVRGGGFFPLGFSIQKTPPLLTATRPDGAFEIAGVVAGVYDVTIDAVGYAITGVPGLQIAEGDGDTDLGTFLVGPGVVIEGLVIDDDDDPLAGAAVAIHTQPSFQRIRESPGPEPWSAWLSSEPGGPAAVESDADGRFVLRDINPREKVDLSVTLEGYLPARAPGVGGPTQEPIRIVLEAAAAVRGRVVDENGEHVASPSITAAGVSTPDRANGRADDEGAFELAKLHAGSWRLEAAAPGYELLESATVELKGGDTKEGVLITLREKAHGEVEGRVVDQDGAAVAAAQVMVHDGGSARTGDDGAFRLERVPLGMQEIRAIASGNRNAAKTLEVREGVNTVELTMESGVDVSGRILDQEGNGVAGAMVSLTAAGGGAGAAGGPARGPGGVFMLVPRTVRSAGGGAFVLPRVADGAYTLLAVLEGQSRARWPGELRVAGTPISGLELVLEKGGVISGALLGLDFDQLSQVRVFAGSEHGGGQGRVSGSEYEVANLDAGEYRVAGDVREHGLHAEGRVTLEAGGQARFDLDFEGGLTLTGVVTRRGEPAVGSILALRGLDVAARRSATIDTAGGYLLRGLEAGSYELTVRAGGRGTHVPWMQTIELHDDTELSIELGAGRVAGFVVDARSGDPIAGATVRMRRAGGTGESLVGGDERKTGAAGEFVYDDVPEGSFALEATGKGYATAGLQIEVRAAAEVEGVVLELEPSSGLTLRVSGAFGFPAWIRTLLLDRGGAPRSAPMVVSPASVGVFEVPGVGEGAWEIVVGSPGLATVRLSVQVPGPPVDVVLPPAGRIAVEIPALLGSSSLADLEVLDASGRRFLSMDQLGSPSGIWRVEAGRASVEGLPPGQWTLRARSLDGSAWTGVAATAPGATSQARLQ
jgi:carboxypeptidase family protein